MKKQNIIICFLLILFIFTLNSCAKKNSLDIVEKQANDLIHLVIATDENSISEAYVIERYKDLFSTEESFTAFVKNRQFIITGWLHNQVDTKTLKWNISYINKEESYYLCKVIFSENDVEISKVIIRYDTNLKIETIRVE